ncbi:MAG: T9SS type A sorting domain-containing protein [Candidatus Eisenbacteria bacterium]|nr:T9SS type A sorting domain-containing protein [Candidatus Eisenbacteria bacterium]
MRRAVPLTIPAVLATLALLHFSPASAAQKRVLFDNTHAETAGNADWIIDTDQPLPVPDQSTVTMATPRTTWLGAISSWGIDLAKRGVYVATLTSAYGITYGNIGNPYDLSKFDAFVIPEPNTPFSAAESTAIFNFVRDGGGIVAVGDHNASDRNSDGWDSPRIYNALDAQKLWGVHWNVTGEGNNNFSQTSTNVASSASDSVLHGPVGDVTGLAFHAGDSFVLYPGINATVRGEVWMNGVPQSSTTQVMAASVVYGNGRIVFVGDSSPADDGSAQPGNSNIFDGWGEAGATDSTLFMNATYWVMRRDVAAADTTRPVATVIAPNGGESWPQGSSQTVQWSSTDNVAVDSVNLDYSVHGAAGPWLSLQHGLSASGTTAWTIPNGATDSALVRATAFDHALNQGNDVSDAMFHVTVPVVGAGNATDALALYRPSPNPGAGPQRLRYSIPTPGRVSLDVLDVAGRTVWQVAAAQQTAGEHSVDWDGRNASGAHAPAGLYFVRLSTEAGMRTQRLVRLR